MQEKKKSISMIRQVAILFIIGVILVSALSSFALYFLSQDNVMTQFMSRGRAVAMGLDSYISEYPAKEWLYRYWYEHYETLDVEYDAEFTDDTETFMKCRTLSERHPDLQLEYARTDEVEALPPEDQDLYAEIIYSWVISRIDQMRTVSDLNYLFCVITEEPYTNQFWLFNAGSKEEPRGMHKGQIFMLGKQMDASEEQKKAMQEAVNGRTIEALSKDREYCDYYFYVGDVDEHKLLIGVTLNMASVRTAITSLIWKFGIIYLLFLAALAGVCLTMLHFSVLRPLKKVQANIRLYKDTKDSSKVINNLSDVHSHNELQQLSGDVAALAKEMDNYIYRIEIITSERERIETELTLANRIQTSMLPNQFPAYPDRKDFDIFASMDPAKEIGGDFYDFYLIDENHLCLTIADVSGKGIPAALYMMASKILLANNVSAGKSPAQVLTDTNRSICSKNPEEMFVTVWLGILDLTTGKLTAANAGHEYPIIMEPDGIFDFYKDKHGFVLGSIPDLEFKEYEIQMEPGSKLFLYTDGLTEATDADRQMFGADRILMVLNEEKDASCEKTIENVRNAVDAFVHYTEPFDDLTMLCVTYNGPEGKAS